MKWWSVVRGVVNLSLCGVNWELLEGIKEMKIWFGMFRGVIKGL